MDPMNARILAALQQDARLSMAELGRRVGLSAPAAAERVRRLQESGAILGYRAVVGLAAVGKPILAFVRISAFDDVKDRVVATARETTEVLECHRGTGPDCFILKVATASIAQLETVTDRFTRFGQITTSLVLSSPLPGRAVELGPAS